MGSPVDGNHRPHPISKNLIKYSFISINVSFQRATHTGGAKNAGKSKKGLNKRGQFFKLDEIQE